MKEKRGKIFNAILKSTGETITIMKEPDGTLFQDFYSDYRRNNYYSESDFDRIDDFKPIEIKLSEKETVDYNKFCDEHKHSDVNFGAIGGKHSLVLTGTGLGYCIYARCNVCGKEKDITDFTTW